MHKEMTFEEKQDWVFEQLKKIPHLTLDKTFDLEKLKEEVSIIDHYEGYRKTKNEDESTFDQYFNNWKGRGLIDIVPDSTMSMMRSPSPSEKEVVSIDNKTKLTLEFDEDGNIITYITDLGERMPYCVQSVYEVTSMPMRARISNIQPHGSITWHSHFQNFLGQNTIAGSKKWRHVILHISIKTNPKVKMGVTKFPLRDNPTQPIYYKTYEEGTLTVFNGWHDHNVFNDSDEERLHIMFYAPLRDPKILDLLVDAIEKYDGPIIDE